MHIGLLIFVIILIIGLAYFIVFTHDCRNKKCSHMIDPPDKDWPIEAKIERFILMAKEIDGGTTWTITLLAAFIIPFPLIWYVNDRLPTFKEWFYSTFIIFIITYFAVLWMTTNFFRPNILQLQDSLNDLITCD